MLKKTTVLALIALMTIATFSVWGGGSSSRAGSAAPTATPSLYSNISGEITMMMWTGDDVYYPDIGSMNLTRDTVTGQTSAAAYAVAKEFKKIYPNVKINFFAKSGSNSDAAGSWEQHRENFRVQYGVYPDIYAVDDMISDMQRGLLADLSVFKDDPMYQSFNPSIMALMNVNGRQFGIPQYILPWGIFVNKSLAEANNIDIPDPNWTIAEYTRFINHSRANEFYGGMGSYGSDLRIVETGTRDFSYMLLHRQGSGPFININSDPTRALLRYVAQWRTNSINVNNELGLISREFMQAHSSYDYRFFTEGKLLTLTYQPWMMGDAAHPDPTRPDTVKVADWDIYPRPSTPYMGNTVGIVLDPLGIRNYAMDDGNPVLSAEEEAKLRLAYEFAKFWCADTRAWQARALQEYRGGDNSYLSSLSDSFPMITGPEFNKQMDIWYIPVKHQRFRDKSKMPGFHYILELWEKGEFWDISDKAYPWRFDFEGGRRTITYEWTNAANATLMGVTSTDPNWLDQVYSRLPQWNTVINQRWDNEWRIVQDVLNRYYPQR